MDLFINCDFDFAADLLIHTFAGGIVPNDLSELLTSYTNDPCRENAMRLVEFDKQEFCRFFYNNRTWLESMMRTRGLNREELSKTLRLNTNLLLQEPEFVAYCEGILDLLEPEAQAKKDALVAKGYTDDMISQAFAEWCQELKPH